MKKKPTARLLIDASMAAAMLFSLAFRITGDFAHEWAGAAALVLFAAHIILNRRWFGGIPKGKYDFRRTLNTAANMALSVAATLVFATGLMSSKHLLGFGASRKHGVAANSFHRRLLDACFGFSTYWPSLERDKIKNSAGQSKCAPHCAYALLLPCTLWDMGVD